MAKYFDISRLFSLLKAGKGLTLLLAAILSISSANVGLALDDYMTTEYVVQQSNAKMEKLAEDNRITAEFYKDKEKVKLDSEIENKLKSIDSSDAKDALKNLQDLSNFTGTSGSKAYNKRGAFNNIDARAENTLQDLNKNLKNLSASNKITAAEHMAILDYAKKNLYAVGAKRAEELAKQQEDISRVEGIKEANQSVAEGFDNCPTVDLIRAKYTSGCWSCLVVEKITSAFMTAASKAYSLSQKAGLILLGLGAVMWLLIWGLRNVSSLTQLEPGNILNELLKFAFKIALAYVFITSGLPMVGKYFINPIMGVGAKIAENFWDKDKIKPYTEQYLWEDEIVTAEEEKAITEKIAKNNLQKLEENTNAEPTEADSIIEPEPVKYDSTEDIVQAIQKAFISILQKQLNEIKNSCGGPCGRGCRFSSCSKPGHVNYVAQIHKMSGTSFNGRTAYCQASIVAAMNQLNSQIGGNVADVLKNVGGNCKDGLDNAANYKNGFSATSVSGGNVTLCINGKMASNLKLNVGDTVYYNIVVEKSGVKRTMGATSGYHAVTYTGGGQTISFNGDSQGSMCNSFYYNVKGRVACLSCMIREKLKKNPQLAQGINTSKLNQLASGYNITLINYNGGVYSSSGNIAEAAMSTPTIGDIKYTGPTDIMSKAVMNSILGATKAIGDITSENMVLGDAIMCYATLDKGGAWHAWSYTITNFWMWTEGAFIWCTGLLLTLAVVYYLLDISFKIGFAVVALPIVVGLWPFDLTRDKFGVCVGIIAKSAAIFAFLAITTSFTVLLTDAVYSYDDNDDGAAQTTDSSGPKGLAKLYMIFDTASQADAGILDDGNTEVDMEYASEKLAVFSTTFVLILFAFLYSYKLVKATVPQLANKFFPDKAFGDQQPMHHLATAATKAVKDVAMKPVGWARDVAVYQSGRLAKGAVNMSLGFAWRRTKDAVGKGDGKTKTIGGRTARGVGNVTKFSGKVGAFAGKGIQAAGRAAQKLNAVIPGLGSAVGGALQAAGKKVENAGKATQKAGQAVKNAGNAVDAAYNNAATRNVSKEDKENKPEGGNNGGEK